MYLKILLICALGIHLCICCDMDQTRKGCRIQNRQCSCGTGCISEYRYATMGECLSALRGRRHDICFPNPCQHGGTCLQISMHPNFKCRCEGTGYHGQRCSRVCPNLTGKFYEGIIPYECVEI